MQQSKFTFLRFISCLSLFAFAACGGDDDGNNDNNQQMMTVDRNVYPLAPYGTEETATLDNLSFKNADASDFTLNDIYSDESNKLLLVSTSSGWCVSCIEEQELVLSSNSRSAENIGNMSSGALTGRVAAFVCITNMLHM